MSVWREVGAGVFVRRYTFFDQNIVAVQGEGEVLIVDTRTTYAQARELVDDLRTLTRDPWIVVNTHHHFDHADGNAMFLPTDIWGHERCAQVLRDQGRRKLGEVAAKMPELATELAEVEVVPPNRTFVDRVTLTVGGRDVALRYLGRGHTDNDIVVIVPDAAVLLAGDLLEEGAPPSFGDSFPLEWAPTVRSALDLMTGPVVPGHGGVVDRTFASAQADEIEAAASAARRIHDEGGAVGVAAAEIGYPGAVASVIAERVFAQLAGSI
jgi:glyoxylase-like metal-dependent hydrolase (beta-lactamase superfamily II)